MDYPSELQQSSERERYELHVKMEAAAREARQSRHPGVGQIIGAGISAQQQNTASVGYSANLPVDNRSPVEKAMERARQRMEHLEGAIDDLVRRLAPVSAATLAGCGSDSTRPMGDCAIAEQLEQIAEHAGRLTAAVAEARDRLCI